MDRPQTPRKETRMKSINSKAAFLAFCFTSLLVLFLSFTKAKAGGRDGGGGSASWVSQPGAKPVLLDLIAFDPNFKDDYADADSRQLVSREYNWPVQGTTIPIAYMRDQAMFPQVNARLAIWEKNSPVLISNLRVALSLVNFHVWAHEVEHQMTFYIPDGLKENYPQASLETVFQYVKEVNAVAGNPRIYNEFGKISQMASFIHEGLRVLQAVDAGFSDETLQNLTARIALTEPGLGESLDDPSLFGPSTFIGAQLENSLSKLEKRFGEICAKSQSILSSSGLESLNVVRDSKATIQKICNEKKPRDLSWYLNSSHEIALSMTDAIPDAFTSNSTRTFNKKFLKVRDESTSLYLRILNGAMKESHLRMRQIGLALKYLGMPNGNQGL